MITLGIKYRILIKEAETYHEKIVIGGIINYCHQLSDS